MANGHGGQRTPANPAAASGPGALSQRTDGGATQAPQVAGGGEYGERAEMMDLQSGAAMQGGGGGPAPGPSRDQLTPLGAPSGRPDEPVTAGADAGAGIGARAAGILGEKEITDQKLRPLMHSLEVMANLPGSNAETRALVRNLKARLSNG